MRLYGLVWHDNLTLIIHTSLSIFTIRTQNMFLFSFSFVLLISILLRKRNSVSCSVFLLLFPFFLLPKQVLADLVFPKILFFCFLLKYVPLVGWLQWTQEYYCNWNCYNIVIPIKNKALLWSYIFPKKELYYDLKHMCFFSHIVLPYSANIIIF